MFETIYLRTNTANTTDFSKCVKEYSISPYTLEIRLCATRRYSHESELPTRDFTLLQNTPLLLAVAVVKLPATSTVLNIVIDQPGLTMQREHRATEVHVLIERLLSSAPKNLYYGLDPIEPTSHLPVESAAGKLLGCDYAQLNKDTLADFLRRLK